jgi:hypothetical protein
MDVPEIKIEASASTALADDNETQTQCSNLNDEVI